MLDIRKIEENIFSRVYKSILCKKTNLVAAYYLPPNYIRGRLRIQVPPFVRSHISMPQLPFSTKFYTVLLYHSTLRMTKFGQNKIQNGRQAAILDKIFNSQYLYTTATILNQILHNCSL